MLTVESRAYVWLQLNDAEFAAIKEHHPSLSPRRTITANEQAMHEFHADDSEAEGV